MGAGIEEAIDRQPGGPFAQSRERKTLRLMMTRWLWWNGPGGFWESLWRWAKWLSLGLTIAGAMVALLKH